MLILFVREGNMIIYFVLVLQISSKHKKWKPQKIKANFPHIEGVFQKELSLISVKLGDLEY